MAPCRHARFDLQILEGESAFTATVLESPAGEGSVRFKAPLGQDDLQWLRQAEPGRRDRDAARRVRRIGSQVFQAVFAGVVGELLRSSLSKVRQTDRGLRLRLRLSEAGELAEFPWEFLFDPACGQFLALQSEVTLVRSLGIRQPVRKATLPPIRMLVVSCLPRNLQQLEAEREWNSLLSALHDFQIQGLFELHRIDSATLEDLEEQLRVTTYHVLHFIGHGSFDPQQERAELLLLDGQGKALALSSEKFSTLLNGQKELRLVVLNCCESARTSLHSPLTGLAHSLIALNVPAVVAMQYPIKDSVALDFVGHFYTNLVSGLPVDAAAAQARRNLYFGIKPPPTRRSGERRRQAALSSPEADWAAPAVYMRSADGFLFDLPHRQPLEIRWGGRPRKVLSRGLSIFALLVVLTLIYVTYFVHSPVAPSPALFGELKIVAQLELGKDSTLIATVSEDSAENFDDQVRISERLQNGSLLIYKEFFNASSAESLAVYEKGQKIVTNHLAVHSTRKPTIQDLRDDSRSGAICQDGVVSEAIGSGACSGHGGVREWIHEPEVVVALLCNDHRLVAGGDNQACGPTGVALQIRNKHLEDFIPAPHDE